MKSIKLVVVSALLASSFAFGAGTGATSGSASGDTDVNTKAASALQTSGSYSNVNVSTENGTVTLEGTVGSEQDAQDAEATVREAVKGMKDTQGNEVQINNSLQVDN